MNHEQNKDSNRIAGYPVSTMNYGTTVQDATTTSVYDLSAMNHGPVTDFHHNDHLWSINHRLWTNHNDKSLT